MCEGAGVWLIGVVCMLWFTGRAVGDCTLPQHPNHGRHQPEGGDCGGEDRPPACDGTPGTTAPEDWLLTVHCDPGYQHPDPSAADVPSVCTNGVWSIPQLSHCVIPDLLTNDRERCTVPEPPPNSQYRLLAGECGGDNLPSGSAVPHDCILFLNCAPGYRRRIGTGDLLTHCSNKTWNPRIPDDLCIRSGDIDTNPEVASQEHEMTELGPTTGVSAIRPPVISATGCVLPKASTYRKFCSLGASCEDCDIYHRRCLIPPGSMVDKVRIVCAPGYSIRTPYVGNIAVCQTNGWYPTIPECLKLCRPLVSEQLQLHCQLGADIVDCSKPALPGTTVTMECLPSFSEYPDLKRQGAYRNTIFCGQAGEWSENLPPCKPACGVTQEVKTFSPTIFNGTQAHIGFFPWHAGLYYRNENEGKVIWDQKCGGSLINEWVILTAAHCVINVHKNNLRIALGKYYRSWDTYEPTEEKRNVSEISFPNQYNSNTFTFDIALLLLTEKIRFGEYVMPVCLDFDEEMNEIRNSNLYVVGWGQTDIVIGGPSSETLLYNTVKAMPDAQCRKAIPVFYTTFEKICAAKNNSESVTQGGDSGGGLTAVYKDGLHYIVGIVTMGVLSRAYTILLKLILLVLSITFIPGIPPDMEFEAYSISPPLPLEGVLSLNNKLNGAQKLFINEIKGPEHMEVYNGILYTTLEGGYVVKMVGEKIVPVVKFGNKCDGLYESEICGRPLGLSFDGGKNMYVADAYYGVFKVDLSSGEHQQLVSMETEINGKLPKLPNSLTVAKDGTVYWSDSSTTHSLHDGLYSVLGNGNGRLIKYDPKTKSNTVLVDKIHFANGVALSQDESFILVSDLFRARILRHFLKGPKAGQTDVFLDGLPGFPDNMHSTSNGEFYVTLPIEADDKSPAITAVLGPYPILRKFLARLLYIMEMPSILLNMYYPTYLSKIYAHWVGSFNMMPVLPTTRTTVIFFNEDGNITKSLHGTDGLISSITDIALLKGYYYLGSYVNPYLARVKAT